MLTNDDGIDAPGIASLEHAVSGVFSVGPSLVAPLGPQSGCGHKVTTHDPISIDRRDSNRFAVDGTPADCVRLAVHHLVDSIDWVIAGINAGGNLGVDVHHSGTVAAVREAVIHGRRGIAISHYIARGRTIDWQRAARWARIVISKLLAEPAAPETFWNVNLPCSPEDSPDPEIVFCRVDPSPLPLEFIVGEGTAQYRGSYQDRPRREGWDVDVCFRGSISVSLVSLTGQASR